MSAHNTMRIYHRYLGFFLAGIMAVYAVSGIVLIFRPTSVFKVEKKIEKTLEPNLAEGDLGKALRIRELKITSTNGDIMRFEQGTYNKTTGVANYTSLELPFVLEKLTALHQASTNKPLYFLNIFFGLSLLFFVLSSFWMFLPTTDLFKKGMYFVIAGVILTLLMIFI